MNLKEQQPLLHLEIGPVQTESLASASYVWAAVLLDREALELLMELELAEADLVPVGVGVGYVG
jgi:hypothetical protein